MMDMELNAELERDGGSESGEASTEGSSAGSVYCTLEQDYARITSEMKGNEALAAYEAEYTRLFESLYKAQRLEEELSSKCEQLTVQVTMGASKVEELQMQVQADAETMERLRRDVLEGKQLADAAHVREQMAREVIENLRVSVAKLTDEVKQKTKQLNLEEQTVAKPTEGGAADRERLVNEIESLRQRMKHLSNYNREIETKLGESEQQLSELQDKFDKQISDIAKEKREREKMETELMAHYEELLAKLARLQTVEDTLKTTSANAAKQENMLKEQVAENDKNQKEIQRLLIKQITLKTEFDKTNIKNERYRKEMIEKSRLIQEMSREITKQKEEATKLRSTTDNAMKRLTVEKSTATKAKEESERVSATLKHALEDIEGLNKQTEADKKLINKLIREKSAMEKSTNDLDEMVKKLTLEIRAYEQTNHKMAASLDEMTESTTDLKRQIKHLENERDRCAAESHELSIQVEDLMDEVKMKRQEITDYQRQIAEAETKHRQQQTMFEDIRAERNSYKKNFYAAEHEINELKMKLKNLNQQCTSMEEQLAAKDAALLKQEFLFSKNEKEKENLSTELVESRKKISELRQELDKMRAEEKRLRNALREADAAVQRHRKEIESVMSERDVIGSQIVRRNDELALQHNKMRILQQTLNAGEREYGHRLDEIRMLRLEVAKLTHERDALAKSSASMSELRAELFQLERTLSKERLKVMALEEEVQSPLNVHRWRNLEGTDPDTFELLKKTHFLQKRILKMSAEMIEKENQVQETEKLYMNLREIVAKQPGPEVVVRLSKTRQALTNRGKRMKCLVAELNMALTKERKFEVERLKKELNSMKLKYHAQKRKNDKATEPSKENLPALPVSPSSPTRFRGGGFSLSAPLAKSAPLITSNK